MCQSVSSPSKAMTRGGNAGSGIAAGHSGSTELGRRLVRGCASGQAHEATIPPPTHPQHKPRSGFCTSERQRAEACRRNMHCTAMRLAKRTPSQTHHPRVAIQFARARYISRSTGGSAVRSAAYNERDGDHRRAHRASCITSAIATRPTHHEVLLPDGRDASGSPTVACCGTRRRRPRSARTRRSPARSCWRCRPTPGSPIEDRIELARSFAEQHFVAKGLAVQLDVHAPHEGGLEESERANWHAHLLITTRRHRGRAVRREEGAGPGPRGAARRRARGGGGRRGLGRAVARSPEPVFPWSTGWASGWTRRRRMPGSTSGRCGCARRVRRSSNGPRPMRQANEAAARDPEQVLATLTRQQRDVHRA